MLSMRHFGVLAWLCVSTPLVLAACDTSKNQAKAEKSDDDDDDDESEKKKKKKKGKEDDQDKPKEKAGSSAEKVAEKTAEPAKPAEPAPTAAPAPAPSAPDVTRPNIGTPEAPVTSPTQQTYPMAGIKTISDTCSNAHVILVTAPESVGVDYEWKYSRQAMVANQQYRVVDGAPRVPGEVSFQVHQADASMMNAFVLVANCADGTTCNHLAAMYKAIVKSSNPQVFCGDIPKNIGPKKKSINLLAGGARANLPSSSDTISKCARLAACTIADKTSTTEDVGISCQKSPTSFKLDCATRYPCAEVLACMK